MIVKPVKTEKVVAGSRSIFDLLDKNLAKLNERSVVAITSKVVAITEGRVVPIGQANKQKLVIAEADYYLPKQLSKFDFSFTITKNTLIPMAGIDESNGNGNYVLWPRDPASSANKIRQYLAKRFGLKNVGVIITDSTARPLHYGTEGVAISYSGFSALNNYVGKPDLFGRPFKVSVANVADSLASAATIVMGEGSEQSPIAVISDVAFVEFQDRDPKKEELDKFYISRHKDDLFAPFLDNMEWKPGDKPAK